MADLKTVTPVLVPEVAESKAVLSPGEAAVYRTVLVPAGKLVEVVVRVAGKEVAVNSWTAAPKVGRNSAVEVRSRVFDAFPVSTFAKSVAVEEPL